MADRVRGTDVTSNSLKGCLRAVREDCVTVVVSWVVFLSFFRNPLP